MKIYQGHCWVRERQDVRDCHPDSCRFFFSSLPCQTILEGSRQGWFTSWPHLVPVQVVLPRPIRVEPACSDFSTHFALSSFFLLFPLPATFLFLYLEANAKWITFYCFLGALHAFLPRLKRKPSILFLAWPFFFFFFFSFSSSFSFFFFPLS